MPSRGSTGQSPAGNGAGVMVAARARGAERDAGVCYCSGGADAATLPDTCADAHADARADAHADARADACADTASVRGR